MNKQTLPEQKNYLFRQTNGDYIFYGFYCGRPACFIGKPDSMQQIRIPNSYNFGGTLPQWVETKRGTLFNLAPRDWVWIEDRQCDPLDALSIGRENYLEELNPEDFDISTSHMTMAIKPR